MLVGLRLLDPVYSIPEALGFIHSTADDDSDDQ